MTQKRPDLYKGGKVFFTRGPGAGEVAEIEILLDGGPLCLGPVWNWKAKERAVGLYFIYFKSHGLHFGPYYASLTMAAYDMRKVLRAFPQKDFWGQSLDWYSRQGTFHEWIDKNMGRPDDLVGGEWAPEEPKPKENSR